MDWFSKERAIKIENLVEFDNESGVGIAKGFGRYGSEGQSHFYYYQ